VYSTPEEGQESKVSKSSLDPGLRFSSIIPDRVHNPSGDPDPTGGGRDLGVGETGGRQQEHEGRDVLQGVLVRALDTVENLAVLRVHVRVLNIVLLPRCSDLESLPHGHEDGPNSCEDNISVIFGQR